MLLTMSFHSSLADQPSIDGQRSFPSALVSSVSPSRSQRAFLPWDSAHFGWKTALLSEPRLSAEELQCQLSQARDEGIRLVYWAAAVGWEPPEDVLRQWTGSMVDRKATFRLELARRPRGPAGRVSQTVLIDEHPCCEASPELVALAVCAGEFSRFRRDRRIPQAAFRRLYETWLQRSVGGEIADRVFVASRSAGGPLGLVTVRVRDGNGEIGLVSVAEAARRQGVGSLLMTRALDWIEASGASVATVVTQLDNTAACRLYERLQFALTDIAHVYHFWPSGACEP